MDGLNLEIGKSMDYFVTTPSPGISRTKIKVSCKKSVSPNRPSYKSPRNVLVLLGVTHPQKIKLVMTLKRQEKIENINLSRKKI